MRPDAAVARLTAGSVWRFGDMGGTGIPVISQEEIAGAMGGLTEEQNAIIRLKWMDDTGCFDLLIRKLLVIMSEWYTGKREIKKGTLQALAAVAIYEVVQPPVCRRCSGTGMEPPPKDGEPPRTVSDCTSCQGIGVKRVGVREKAKIASKYRGQVGKSQWHDIEKEFAYDRVYQRVAEWESDGLRHIWKQLNRDAV